MAEPLEDVCSGSSLSSAPDNLVITTESVTVVRSTDNSKKRKAETTLRTKKITALHTEADDAVAVASDSPRPKRRAAKRVKYEQDTDEEMVTQERDNDTDKSKKASPRRTKKEAAQELDVDAKQSSQPKRGPAKKPHVEEKTNDKDAIEDTKVTNKSNKTSVTKTTKNKAEDNGEDKPKKTARSKAKPAKILPPIAERTKDIKLRVGAHVSIAGGQSYLAFQL
jgi:AP endonuclease-1